jgi:hypothetical protein
MAEGIPGKGNSPCTLLASVTLDEGSVDSVSKGELGEVLGSVVLVLISLEGI